MKELGFSMDHQSHRDHHHHHLHHHTCGVSNVRGDIPLMDMGPKAPDIEAVASYDLSPAMEATPRSALRFWRMSGGGSQRRPSSAKARVPQQVPEGRVEADVPAGSGRPEDEDGRPDLDGGALQGANSVPVLVDTVVAVKDKFQQPALSSQARQLHGPRHPHHHPEHLHHQQQQQVLRHGDSRSEEDLLKSAKTRRPFLYRGHSRVLLGSAMAGNPHGGSGVGGGVGVGLGGKRGSSYLGEPEIEKVKGPDDADIVETDEEDVNDDDEEDDDLEAQEGADEVRSLRDVAGPSGDDHLNDIFNEDRVRRRVSMHNGRSKKKHKNTFTTRYKLERGTMSAFRREAKHIIERDLPHISHRDNIIRVWADRGPAAQLRAVANKHKSNLRFSLNNLSINLKYFFQHPYLRLFVSYFVIFCNFLVFAEDPVSHSNMEADIPVVGNVFSFVITKYPPDWRWQLLKVTMWLLAIGCGLVVGKTIIHGMLLSRFLKLKMFRADQGSWMVQFFTVIVSLYLFSHAYNVLLVLNFQASKQFTINSKMGITNSNLMKAAACGTWMGDLITALIVTDMMLQDNLYPKWAPRTRKMWRKNNALRIGVFWCGSILVTTVVIMVIATDWITWDRLNRDFVASTELSRAFLCSFVLVMDLMIVMQDWDFPHFTNTLDVNLPGFYKHLVNFKRVEIQISGKWFNYGIIFLVMIFDLNMWKNQIFYFPEYYGQYTATDNRVYTVTNISILLGDEPENWSYDARSQINPDTHLPYMDEDIYMHSRYLGYSMLIKAAAFVPCVLGFVTFFAMIGIYGRISEEDVVADKVDNASNNGSDGDVGGTESNQLEQGASEPSKGQPSGGQALAEDVRS